MLHQIIGRIARRQWAGFIGAESLKGKTFDVSADILNPNLTSLGRKL
jgi:hypothetical protein